MYKIEDVILNTFLNTWPLERVRKMELEEYNKQGSKDTFCYMLEYGTKQLGNISGISNSSKFEIYERKDKNKTPKSSDYGFDSDYTWRNRNGVIKDRQEAFRYTKDIIVSIIESVQNNDFRKVDGLGLAPLVVWKIAFIYSDKNLLSISDRKAVRYLARLFEMPNYNNARISDLHKYLMPYVQVDTFWDDMDFLWSLCIKVDKTDSNLYTENTQDLLKRKGVTIKEVKNSLRKSNAKKIIILKNHNKLQQKLFNELVDIHGEHNVIMEENNIDIKVEYQNKVDLYEVKIASSAKYCIRLALGQIIEYAFNYQTTKSKNLVIVGNHQLTDEDVIYVNHIKDLLVGVNFEYHFRNAI